MPQSPARRASRRRILSGMAAGAVAASAGTIFPPRRAWASARTVHKSGGLEAIVMSDGHFVLPMGFLVTPDAPPVEREAALKAAGQSGDQLQLVNNVDGDPQPISGDPGRRGDRSTPPAHRGKVRRQSQSRRHRACSGHPGGADARPSRSSMGHTRRQREPDLSERELCRLARRVESLGRPGRDAKDANGLAQTIASSMVPRTTSRASRTR